MKLFAPTTALNPSSSLCASIENNSGCSLFSRVLTPLLHPVITEAPSLPNLTSLEKMVSFVIWRLLSMAWTSAVHMRSAVPRLILTYARNLTATTPFTPCLCIA